MTKKLVQHRSPQTYQAKAPYNFVPLPEEVLAAEEFAEYGKYQADRHTGYLKLEITTETPLYTRCAVRPSVYANPANFDEKGKLKVTAVPDCQEFFHRGDREKTPVIPGSSLRGMTRNLVEILAYGKMNFVTDSAIIHRAVADPSSLGKRYREQMLGKNKDYPRIWHDYPSPNLRGGYLEVINDEWFIRPALEQKEESFIHVSYESAKTAFGWELARHKAGGYVCWVIPRERRTKEKSDKFKLDMATTGQISFTEPDDMSQGWRKAKLVVSGFMQGKKMECAIYDPDETAKLIKIKYEDRLLYEEDMRLPREPKNKPRKLQHGEPLFYLLNDEQELVFFGSTMMFRLPYTNTVHCVIPELLRRHDQVDLAEAIFGTVESPNRKKQFPGRQLAGRVFFTDAVCQSVSNVFYQNDKQGRFVSKILSSPKPTSFQIYLAQPEPNHYEPRDAQNGQDDLKAKWYLVTDKALRKMEEDGVPDGVLDKVRKLLGHEFMVDDDSKADAKFIRTLKAIGVTYEELRGYKKNILRCSAHELRTYYDHYDSEYGTVIRGAKRYWHKKEVLADSSEQGFVAEDTFVITEQKGVKGVFDKTKKDKNGNWPESTQHTIIKPVKAGVKFVRGRVYFENLSAVELGALLAALDLPSNMRHQIGMAKPYGLGTVKIDLKEVVLQDRKTRYQSLFDEQSTGWNMGYKTPENIEAEKQTAISAFHEAVLAHHNQRLAFSSQVSDIWQIPRLQDLATMLEWQDANNFGQKRYANLKTDKPMWHNRYVLPRPQELSGDNQPAINQPFQNEQPQTAARETEETTAEPTVPQKLAAFTIGEKAEPNAALPVNAPVAEPTIQQRLARFFVAVSGEKAGQDVSTLNIIKVRFDSWGQAKTAEEVCRKVANIASLLNELVDETNRNTLLGLLYKLLEEKKFWRKKTEPWRTKAEQLLETVSK